ncbi:aminotransferase class I/II-fold pyridoxal phosphate-dependent enzyme, partial [Spirulina sp. 06S082]|uniref:aminotransferase class I/II-fold pyridoxal phosphate-dependent enzyme n=1 Tax=Spirulina sp. 06S082 TaxID=3110248 RepID=UPI002B1F7C1F
ETANTQPALFALEYALAQLWQAWGIQPTVLLGHSIGEYVAACWAGIFSLEDALHLIAARGRLMQSLPRDLGGMVAVRAGKEQVQKFLDSHLVIAAINGPESTVISGPKVAIATLTVQLEQAGIQSKPLNVSHGFHSPLMDPILSEFRTVAESVHYTSPNLAIVSTLTGNWVGEEMTTPDYWVRHLRQPVRFMTALQALSSNPRYFVEIGAKPILLAMAQGCLHDTPYGNASDRQWLPSLRPSQSDRATIFTSLARLYAEGAQIHWQAVEPETNPASVSLPLSPFQRQRYWWDTPLPNSVPVSPSGHPLLGDRLALAGTQEQRYQNQIGVHSLPYLGDHCVLDRVVFPAAAYLEIMLAARGETEMAIAEMAIEQPLFLTDKGITLQTLITPDSRLEIFSGSDEEESFHRHAIAKIVKIAAQLAPQSLSDLQTTLTPYPIDRDRYYQTLKEQGLTYGETFRSIEALWHHNGQALSRIRLQPEIATTGYFLHPILLDACLQTIGATVTDLTPDGTYLPIGLDSLHCQQQPSTQHRTYWCGVTLHANSETHPQTLKADLWIWDETGAIAATIAGMTLQYVSNVSLEQKFATTSPQDWCYELVWQPQPRSQSSSPPDAPIWLIFGDRQGVASHLIQTLQKQHGDRCILVTRGKEYRINDSYILNPTDPQDFQHLLNDLAPLLISSSGTLTCRIAYLWGLDLAEEPRKDLTAQQEICGGLLHLVQAIATMPALSAQLWVVTRGTQALGIPCPLQPQQATLWGFARTLRLERPDLPCTCIDLDPSPPAENWDELLADLRSPDGEDQIAYRYSLRERKRTQQRFVARLQPYVPPALTLPKGESFRLGMSDYGVLDNLTLIPTVRRSPAAGEVEIQVKAAGVNFRDVLNALGMLQPVLEEMGFTSAEEVPFGGECAGTIARVGTGVEGLQVGDAVIVAPAIGSLNQFVTVSANFVVAKPSFLTFAEAATLPTTFLTAYYGLVHLANLQPGDRILIHAAAGGVGQAAIQIARQIGAEIFATASPKKWAFLRSQGITKVMNSRSLDFAEEILAVTQGQGVDVVFNSLNGEAIAKNIESLAPQGRFVEIGKIGIWSREKMQQSRPDVTYFPFDLLEVAQTEPQRISEMLGVLREHWCDRSFIPLTKTVFPITDAPKSFHYMARAHHVGKVVLTFPSSSIILPHAAYVITGGSGALGLQVAQWLASQGAKHLTLMGRRSPAPEALEVIQQLEQEGVTISFLTVDVAEKQDLQKALTKINSIKTPLKGIFHLAGVLEDALLANQTWPRFSAVMRPKLLGAWNLHNLTQNLDLDFFVCFSSIASLFGSPGQGNYAAANAFLDAIAHHRHALGLPALSINWGPWGEVGMAAQVAVQNRWRDRGLTPITPEQGLEFLTEMLAQPRPQIGIFPIDWATFLSDRPADSLSPLWETLKPHPPTPPMAPRWEIIEQLATQPEGDHQALLTHYLQGQLAKVMGFNSPEAIDPQTTFGDLGMDSLMAVEFGNRLQTQLGRPIPQTLTFDYPTLAALAGHLAEILDIANVPLSPSPPETPETPETPPPAPKNPETPALVPEAYTPPPEHYTFALMPDYLRLRQDLDRVEKLGNPFFTVRDGIARETVAMQGRSLLNYSSYNYLGLSGDPRVTEASQKASACYGTSVSASRVLSGERPLHRELERAIAQFLGTEDSIVYIGGHATNVTTIGHLFQEKDLILYDALSHNSIREGCRLSGATAMEFPHNDWQALDRLLQEHRPHYEKVLVAIEGVYSTDGDLAPLPQIIQVKSKHHAFLLVDEAHSLGVLGTGGRGIGEHFHIAPDAVDLWMGTLSKSLASCGGYIAGSAPLVEYLKYTAPGFVFSVGMTPSNAAAALAALQIVTTEPERVAQVQARSRLFLSLARECGLNTGASGDSPIIPIIVGEPQKAVQLSHALFQQGIDVQPMVYPSVPYNAARLRFFLSCLHSEAQIRKTVQILADELLVLETLT